ncbi:uncharacterized protein H6S33_006826 [Morchella sextelata]|uniref:uncharacterized protein n=1 Tax=Morchella sextelata TaxID=1174677 RepID=UPI001D050830|nr:uncharacterized protein H6S33_006826 [Morchella sextelata]KAH0604449.1 hypothetical protein H6S33_006826 [Morchella sextelata]
MQPELQIPTPYAAIRQNTQWYKDPIVSAQPEELDSLHARCTAERGTSSSIVRPVRRGAAGIDSLPPCLSVNISAIDRQPLSPFKRKIDPRRSFTASGEDTAADRPDTLIDGAHPVETPQVPDTLFLAIPPHHYARAAALPKKRRRRRGAPSDSL